MRVKRGNGRLAQRLIAMLAEQGYLVTRLMPAEGHWCSSPYADVYRWEATVICPDGVNRPLGCWETITECVRSGFTVAPDSLCTLEAYAKSKNKYEKARARVS